MSETTTRQNKPAHIFELYNRPENLSKTNWRTAYAHPLCWTHGKRIPGHNRTRGLKGPRSSRRL